MKVIYRNPADLTDLEKKDIWEILCQCDDEFYPRLSARNSSSQKNLLALDSTADVEKPYVYYEEMIKQEFLLLFAGSRMEGFITFKRDYLCEALEKFGTSAYITTVCVRKESRKAGYMKEMYSYLEQHVCEICSCNKVSTRTWSLNEAQLHALDKYGYARIAVLPDDRGPGVDTIYFGKTVGKP